MPGRVLITRPIPGAGPDLIARVADEVVAMKEDRPLGLGELRDLAGGGFDAVVCMLHDPVDGSVLEAAKGCQVFANMAVGYNNIDVAAADRLGILVTNTPGVLTEATADLTWALILAVSRRVAEGDREMRGGRFPGWGPNYMLGGDVTGSDPRAGRAGADRRRGGRARGRFPDASPLSWQEREPRPRGPRRPAGRARRAPRRERLRQPARPPDRAETTHLIDARALALMKPSAYLINTSRGPVVDEAALVDVLRAGRIAGAGLDVYEREPAMAEGLAGCENAVLLPHLGSATRETRERMSRIAGENVVAVLEGRRPPNLVNPSAWRGGGAGSASP